MTTTLPEKFTGPQLREFVIREVSEANAEGERTFTGLAVPWDDEITMWGDTESVAPGAVTAAENVLVLYRHNNPIGRVISYRDTDAGWEITGVISRTPAGDEVYTLMRDGVIDRMSIGFVPVKYEVTDRDDGTVAVRHTEIFVKEVSLVPFPAYDGAKVSAVRSAPESHPEKENTMPVPALVENTDLTEVRTQLADQARSIDALLARPSVREEPTIETRSVGQLLKAACGGETAAIAALDTRAYTGSTSVDTINLNQWVGDLTRFVEAANPLGALFETAALPPEGLTLEFGELETNTVQVADQTAEGADLVTGKVKVKTRTAPVKTLGGYVELTRQEIERSSVAILNHNYRALAIALGKHKAATLRAAYDAAVTAQVTALNTVSVPLVATATYKDWLNAIVDAAVKYEDLGLALDALVVDTTNFKQFLSFTGSDGRPLFTVSGTGSNVVGSLNVKSITGDMASVPVILNAKQAAAGAAFVNRSALRVYSSGAVQLQDENVINLSQAVSLYQYQAIASEIPAAIVPVKRGA